MAEDPLHLEAELFAGNQSEIGIPILSGDNLLGVMDVQSTRSTAFDNETIVVLQMLASQVATAIYNVRLLETEQGGIQEIINAYQTGYKIDRTVTENEVYQTIQELFSKTSYVSMLLASEGQSLKAIAKSDAHLPVGQSLPDLISISASELEPFLTPGIFIGEGNRLNTLPYNLISVLRQLEIFSAALIPLMRSGSISGVLIIATREKNPLVQSNLQPYINLIGQLGTTLDRIQEIKGKENRLAEMETISLVSSGIAQARTDKEVLEAVQDIFQGTPKAAILLVAENNNLRMVASANLSQDGETPVIPEWLNVSPGRILEEVGNRISTMDVSQKLSLNNAQSFPELSYYFEDAGRTAPTKATPLQTLILQAKFHSVGFIPIIRNEELSSLIIVGTSGTLPLSALIQSLPDINQLIVAGF